MGGRDDIVQYNTLGGRRHAQEHGEGSQSQQTFSNTRFQGYNRERYMGEFTGVVPNTGGDSLIIP